MVQEEQEQEQEQEQEREREQEPLRQQSTGPSMPNTLDPASIR